MSKELVKIEDISIDNAPDIYIEGGLDQFINATKKEVDGVIFDLSTAKGRKEVASLSAKVSKSKKAVENTGREYLKKLKAQPKIIEAELREFVLKMDELRDETRKPLNEWEAEQARIEAEKQAQIEAENLAAQIETDHEIAILLDEKFDREQEENEKEIERQRLAYEQKLKQEAAEKAEREKLEAIEREKSAKIRADKAEEDAKLQAIAAEQARIESEKQAKIREEEAKLQAEANAIKAAEDAKNKEIARQEAVKQAEIARREQLESDKKHVGSVRRKAKEALMSECGLTEDQAKSVVLKINSCDIPSITISYI